MIEWFRELLNFCMAHIAENKAVNATIAGERMCELTELQAVELEPEIEALFDEKMVQPSFCGSRSSVLRDIWNPRYAGTTDTLFLDIHQRFDDMRRKLGHIPF